MRLPGIIPKGRAAPLQSFLHLAVWDEDVLGRTGATTLGRDIEATMQMAK